MLKCKASLIGRSARRAASIVAIGLLADGRRGDERLWEPRCLFLGPNDWVPNNPRLPLMIYRNAVHFDDPDIAGNFEALFERHGWRATWRGTVHDQHHYHVHAHEVLGIAEGSAILMMGGARGTKIAVDAGDAILIPAGVAHCRLSMSADMQVVAAYPSGQHWAVHSTAPTAAEIGVIQTLEYPHLDPVLGPNRPLPRIRFPAP